VKAVTEALLDLVNTELLPRIAPLGFKVVETDVSESFDNAAVTLQGPAFRVRVVRERSIVFVDLGPNARARNVVRFRIGEKRATRMFG
jgi:hypothetical protein